MSSVDVWKSGWCFFDAVIICLLCIAFRVAKSFGLVGEDCIDLEVVMNILSFFFFASSFVVCAVGAVHEFLEIGRLKNVGERDLIFHNWLRLLGYVALMLLIVVFLFIFICLKMAGYE